MARRKTPALDLRPLTARSVLLSTLLGLDPPALPVARLVASARLFGITEGTARVALSRMVTAGEVVVDDGRYRLAGRLLERQRRQATGRRPPEAGWNGAWHVAVVTAAGRPAAERAELRAHLSDARLAEWREGVWTRPGNIAAPSLPAPLDAHASWLRATPLDDPGDLAARLWDLERWTTTAEELLDRLAGTRAALDAGDTDALAPGFVLSAAVLRHLTADPLLPEALLPAGWPGAELRATYDAWDTAYRSVLAAWHRSHP